MADHKRIRREDGSPRSTADSGSEGDDDSDTGAGGRAGPARGGTAAGSQDATADFMRQSQAAQQSARRSRGRRSRPSATPAEDSEDSGEDIMENMESDYRVIPELDRYDDELLDDAEHEELDIAERQAVDEMLAQRDAKEHRPRMSRCVAVAVAVVHHPSAAGLALRTARLALHVTVVPNCVSVVSACQQRWSHPMTTTTM